MTSPRRHPFGNPQPAPQRQRGPHVAAPWLGPVILFALLFVVFQAVFAWAKPLQDGLDDGVNALIGVVKGQMPASLLRDFLTDGVLAGVGAVVVFLPQIIILFFFILCLEASGYMARAAFLMDRLMAGVGLRGAASFRCFPALPARCRASWPRAASPIPRTG
jgi:Fe2+ transport system protein B